MNQIMDVPAEDSDDHEIIAWRPGADLVAGDEQGQIYSIFLAGDLARLRCTGGFVLAVNRSGNAYASDAGRRCVFCIDGSGATTVFYREASGGSLVHPNMAPSDSRGSYVIDSGIRGNDDGCIVTRSPEAGAVVWSKETPPVPEGLLVLHADDEWLDVVESRLPGIMQVSVRADRRAGESEVMAMLPATAPDGVAFDIGARAYIACDQRDAILCASLHGVSRHVPQ